MRWLLDADRRRVLRFAPLQGETARDVLARHPGSDDTLSTVVYVRDFRAPGERVFRRSAAALAILEDLGGGYRALAWLRVIPRPIRDALYDFVADRRYRWFGTLPSCRLPDGSAEARFLP
jgi:predicted DCC family thiol-disulfide oxidoreductase YuxK